MIVFEEILHKGVSEFFFKARLLKSLFLAALRVLVGLKLLVHEPKGTLDVPLEGDLVVLDHLGDDHLGADVAIDVDPDP